MAIENRDAPEQFRGKSWWPPLGPRWIGFSLEGRVRVLTCRRTGVNAIVWTAAAQRFVKSNGGGGRIGAALREAIFGVQLRAFRVENLEEIPQTTFETNLGQLGCVLAR